MKYSIKQVPYRPKLKNKHKKLDYEQIYAKSRSEFNQLKMDIANSNDYPTGVSSKVNDSFSLKLGSKQSGAKNKLKNVRCIFSNTLTYYYVLERKS